MYSTQVEDAVLCKQKNGESVVLKHLYLFQAYTKRAPVVQRNVLAWQGTHNMIGHCLHHFYVILWLSWMRNPTEEHKI